MYCQYFAKLCFELLHCNDLARVIEKKPSKVTGPIHYLSYATTTILKIAHECKVWKLTLRLREYKSNMVAVQMSIARMEVKSIRPAKRLFSFVR